MFATAARQMFQNYTFVGMYSDIAGFTLHSCQQRVCVDAPCCHLLHVSMTHEAAGRRPCMATNATLIPLIHSAVLCYWGSRLAQSSPKSRGSRTHSDQVAAWKLIWVGMCRMLQ